MVNALGNTRYLVHSCPIRALYSVFITFNTLFSTGERRFFSRDIRIMRIKFIIL